MRLEQIHFKGFRSIQDVTLSQCGGFNVLIGKNNAGKSNVLLGINAFFECIRNGEPVNITPPIGRPIDYHGQLQSPIELTLTFN
jgi:AAA15 family ATPase/GTPase